MRYDICAVRAFAILLIVLHHAAYYLTQQPYGIDSTPIIGDSYSIYISSFSKIAGLGLFTYISGMLLAMQADRPRNVSRFLIKKFMRLLVPATIFLAAYELIFRGTLAAGWYHHLTATHLWYLPFIFIALVTTYLLRPGWNLIGGVKVLILWALCYAIQYHAGIYTHQMELYYPIFIAGYFHKHICNRYTAAAGYILATILFVNRFYHPIFNWVFYTPIIGILASWAVVYTAGRVVRGPLGRVGTLLDRQSFHIYLIHQFVLNFILMALPLSGLAIKWTFPVFLLTLGGSLALCLAYDAASASVVRAYRRLRPVNTP